MHLDLMKIKQKIATCMTLLEMYVKINSIFASRPHFECIEVIEARVFLISWISRDAYSATYVLTHHRQEGRIIKLQLEIKLYKILCYLNAYGNNTNFNAIEQVSVNKIYIINITLNKSKWL